MPGRVATFATCSTARSSTAFSISSFVANTMPGTRMPGTAPSGISQVKSSIRSTSIVLASHVEVHDRDPPTVVVADRELMVGGSLEFRALRSLPTIDQIHAGLHPIFGHGFRLDIGDASPPLFGEQGELV